jgi:hypothetical protein
MHAKYVCKPKEKEKETDRKKNYELISDTLVNPTLDPYVTNSEAKRKKKTKTNQDKTKGKKKYYNI